MSYKNRNDARKYDKEWKRKWRKEHPEKAIERDRKRSSNPQRVEWKKRYSLEYYNEHGDELRRKQVIRNHARDPEEVKAKRQSPEFKEYHRRKAREYYHRDKAKYREKQKATYNRLKEKILANKSKKYLSAKAECIAYLGGKCSVCGFSEHHAALSFHHRDRGCKKFELSRMIQNGQGVVRLREELDKCDLLCLNCHAVWHFEHGVKNPIEKGAL